MFHGVKFGEDGEPLIPPRVDEELWRLELPSILGVGYGRGPGESDEEAVAEECAEEVSPTDSVAHGTCAHQDPMLLHPASQGAVMPHVTLEVTYQQASTCLPSAWNVPDAAHTYVLDPVPFPMEDMPAHQAELFSMRMLRRGHLDMCDFSTLLELLDGACAGLKRKCASGDVSSGAMASFSVGAFVQGGLGGVLKCTRAFPWAVRLLVAVVRGCCYNHRFNAVSLHRNTFMAPRTDSHNARGFPNLVLPCSRWVGGGIWMAEATHLSTLVDASILGRVHAVRFPYVLLDPHVLHGTQIWSGDRIILIAYAVRDVSLIGPVDTRFLADYGFTVNYGGA